jgi:hypothetical protein
MLLQTENLLLVGLGFGLGLLLCMIVGFSIWAAANRWRDRKRRLAVPATILDLQAEREALRAKNAMVQSRYEMLLESARNTGAEHEAEVVRHRNRALQAGETLAAVEAENQKLRKLVDTLAAETKARGLRIAALEKAELDAVAAAEKTAKSAARPLADNVVQLPVHAPATDKSDVVSSRLAARVAQLQAVSVDMTTDKPITVVDDVTHLADEAAPAPAPEPDVAISVAAVEDTAAKLVDPMRSSGLARLKMLGALLPGSKRDGE